MAAFASPSKSASWPAADRRFVLSSLCNCSISEADRSVFFLVHCFSILIEDRTHACLGDQDQQVSKADNRQEQPPRPMSIIHFRVSSKVPQLIVPQTILSSTGPLPCPCQSNWKSTALIIHLISSSRSMASSLLTSTVIETLYFLSGTCRFRRSFIFLASPMASSKLAKTRACSLIPHRFPVQYWSTESRMSQRRWERLPMSSMPILKSN
jgi:hypothetical protein